MATSEDSSNDVSVALAEVPPQAGPRAANPAALTVEQIAKAMGVSVDTIRRHVEDGAPAAHDGTINLIHFAAWLNQRLRGNDGD